MQHRNLLITMLTLALLGGNAAQLISQTNPVPTAFRASSVPTQFVTAGSVRYAYRSYGPASGTPLLLINRFRGTLDDWDPQLLDLLAAERHVITFDNAGFALSTGVPAKTLSGLAEDTIAFVHALGFHQVDVLGFSYGGYTAEEFALDHPETVRRLILASSGPGFVEATPTNPAVFKIAGKPVNTDDDLLYLFFKDTPRSHAAGVA